MLASVARTIGQRCLDLTTVLTTMLRAPRPTVPAALQTRISADHPLNEYKMGWPRTKNGRYATDDASTPMFPIVQVRDLIARRRRLRERFSGPVVLKPSEIV